MHQCWRLGDTSSNSPFLKNYIYTGIYAKYELVIISIVPNQLDKFPLTDFGKELTVLKRAQLPLQSRSM